MIQYHWISLKMRDFQPWFEADDHAAAGQLVDNADVAAALADDKPETETKVDESTLQPKGFAARFCQPEDSDPPLQDETAESLKFLLHFKLQDTTVTEICDKYPRLTNVKLIVPKVNPVIWDSISSKAQHGI